MCVHPSVHEIVDADDPVVGDLEAHDVRLGARALGRLFGIDVAAVPVVLGDLAARLLLRAHGGEPLLRAEAEVRGARVDQILSGLLIEWQPLRLNIRRVWSALARALVPRDAHPVQAVVDRVDRALYQAILVGVLDAEDERALVLAREEVVVEGRADAADVQRPGG